jgi:hypothetical protein
MDIESLCVGFLVGAFTSAAGSYLGNKYTDKRRDKEEVNKARKAWADVKRRYPKLIDEMVADLSKESDSHIRCFVVIARRSLVGFMNERVFAYYTDEHPLLMSAVEGFVEAGFIKDITEKNLPRYRMSEQFVDKLLDK